MPLSRRLLAEALGTAFLLAAVVGSGIMGERLAGGNVALALLANALATGCGLFAFILVFAPVSGGHFNPAVSLAMTLRGVLPRAELSAYVAAQIGGAFCGVAAAHAMFGLPLFAASTHARLGGAQAWSEGVATFGLVLVVLAVGRRGLLATALAVAAYVTAGYWFTVSTAFANPAVSLARACTDTFAGIRIDGVPWFVLAQLAGTLAAVGAERLLLGSRETAAAA
jgi:glycerol uptake facilitator-like aquaporin